MLNMGTRFLAGLCVLVISAALTAPITQAVDLQTSQSRPAPSRRRAGWKLTWADEFTGAALNRKKWEVMVANGCQFGIPGWGNNEREWYTDLPENLRVEGGNLVVTAIHNPAAASFTSARVRTWGKYSVAPSATHPTIRVEARIKVPLGLGLWPAFWMLPDAGSNAGCSGCGMYGTWAASGELDIMEMANDMKQLIGTLHFGGAWPANTYVSKDFRHPSGASFADDFHVFSLEWEQKQMRWYVDEHLYATQYSGNGTRNGWFSLGQGASPDSPFDQNFYLILNLALGSEGTPFTTIGGVGVTEAQLKATLAQPQAMLVDYVRVYGKV